MPPLLIAAALVALIAISTVAGFLGKASQGRSKEVRSSASENGIPGLVAGQISLVQFSSQVCAPCVSTRHLLSGIAETTDAVNHIEFDVAEHPGLVSRWGVMQTPTTLLVDHRGTVRSRIGGAPRPAELLKALERISSENAITMGTGSAAAV